jgi:hypothetical protein
MKKMYLFALTVTLIVTSCGQKKGEDIPLVRPVKTATVSSQSVILKDFSGMVEALISMANSHASVMMMTV